MAGVEGQQIQTQSLLQMCGDVARAWNDDCQVILKSVNSNRILTQHYNMQLRKGKLPPLPSLGVDEHRNCPIRMGLAGERLVSLQYKNARRESASSHCGEARVWVCVRLGVCAPQTFSVFALPSPVLV